MATETEILYAYGRVFFLLLTRVKALVLHKGRIVPGGTMSNSTRPIFDIRRCSPDRFVKVTLNNHERF